MQVACLTGNHQKEWRYYTHDVEAFLDAFNACLAGHPAYPLQLRTRIPTGTPCRDCSPKAQTSFIERRSGGGCASDRRQEGVGVSCLAFPVGKDADQIALRAAAADVVPAHVIAVFIQGDARQQFERFAVAHAGWRAGSASSA